MRLGIYFLFLFVEVIEMLYICAINNNIEYEHNRIFTEKADRIPFE